jgi:hypothetical protein
VICSKVKGKEKLLVSKLDNLLKHGGNCKVIISSLGVELGFFNFKNDCQHACNERIYTTCKCCSIFYLIDFEILHEMKQKSFQFVIINHLLF